MSDLIARLREWQTLSAPYNALKSDLRKAAAALEAKDAEIERLRADWLAADKAVIALEQKCNQLQAVVDAANKLDKIWGQEDTAYADTDLLCEKEAEIERLREELKTCCDHENIWKHAQEMGYTKVIDEQDDLIEKLQAVVDAAIDMRPSERSRALNHRIAALNTGEEDDG